MRPASYDPGEKIRVTRDAKGVLHVLHGANEVATIKRILGGAVKVEADGRSWRLEESERGWVAGGADGVGVAELRSGPLRTRLRVGEFEAKVTRHEVKGLLKLKPDKSQGKPFLSGEILGEPGTSDPHALIAFAAAAIALDRDLQPAAFDRGGDASQNNLAHGFSGLSQ